MLMTEQITKMRNEDKLGLKARFKPTKELPYVGLRPVSSGCGTGVFVRKRLANRKGVNMMQI